MTTLEFAIAIIAVALVFDFVNGWHDSANSIATVVATRVLSPGAAVIWAAFFNFAAFLLFGTLVAQTIGGDLIRLSTIQPECRMWTLLSALLGAKICAFIVISRRVGVDSDDSRVCDSRRVIVLGD